MLVISAANLNECTRHKAFDAPSTPIAARHGTGRFPPSPPIGSPLGPYRQPTLKADQQGMPYAHIGPNVLFFVVYSLAWAQYWWSLGGFLVASEWLLEFPGGPWLSAVVFWWSLSGILEFTDRHCMDAVISW